MNWKKVEAFRRCDQENGTGSYHGTQNTSTSITPMLPEYYIIVKPVLRFPNRVYFDPWNRNFYLRPCFFTTIRPAITKYTIRKTSISASQRRITFIWKKVFPIFWFEAVKKIYRWKAQTTLE